MIKYCGMQDYFSLVDGEIAKKKLPKEERLRPFGTSYLLSPTIKSGKGDSPLRNGLESRGITDDLDLQHVEVRIAVSYMLNVEDIIVDTQTQDPNEQQQLSLKAAGQHGKTSSAMDELLSGVRAAFAGVSTVRLPASQRNETKPVFQKAKQATRAKSDPHVPYRFSSPFSFLTGRTSSNSSGRHKQFFHRARTNPAQEQPRKQSIGTSSLSSGDCVTSRRGRLRLHGTNLLTWTKREGSEAKNDNILKILPQDCKTANSTKSFRIPSRAETKTVENIGSIPRLPL